MCADEGAGQEGNDRMAMEDGNDRMAMEDVWGIGKAIGVKFKGDNSNMFNVLSRVGKDKQVGGDRNLASVLNAAK
ncbi:hypothetical protein A2U01_0043026 [Trifolium medium]|uniref:Uncharacterized protein n=1 Tax=Trifolium medium TaxID=97028 RepID=A0A392QF07_9FABA|nr:hypothetical protein [Trifolium medium]